MSERTNRILDCLERIVNKSPSSHFQLGVFNACDYSKLLQAGAINVADKLIGLQSACFANFAHTVYGIQSAPLNVSLSELTGVQCGLICYAGKGNYLQLGLFTFRGNNGPWYTRFTPFIGYNKSKS